MTYNVFYDEETGKIVAITKFFNPELKKHPQFKIDDEMGLKFLSGEYSTQNYIAGTLLNSDKRVLKKRLSNSDRTIEDGLYRIPEKDECILQIKKSKDKITFLLDSEWINNQTEQEKFDWLKFSRNLTFYLTDHDNPYKLYEVYNLCFEKLFKKEPIIYDLTLEPHDFSLWTLKMFESYGIIYDNK